jgi:hypothetical protein
MAYGWQNAATRERLNRAVLLAYGPLMRTVLLIGCAVLASAAGPAPTLPPTRAECLAQHPVDDLQSLPIGSTLSRDDVARINALKACLARADGKADPSPSPARRPPIPGDPDD